MLTVRQTWLLPRPRRTLNSSYASVSSRSTLFKHIFNLFPSRSRDCPQSGWYWNSKQGCCTPRHENPPEPSCKRGYSWSKGSWCCEEDNHPTTTSRAQPSQTPPSGGYNGGNNGGYNGGNQGGYNGGNQGGYNGGNHGSYHGKVKRHSRNVELCPSKLTACPIAGSTTFNKSSDYEWSVLSRFYSHDIYLHFAFQH
jgi:hypothetical protein